MRSSLFLLFLLAFSSVSLYADTKEIGHTSLRGNGMSFIENKGQITDMNGNIRPDILYTGDGGGMQVYLRKGGISYVMSKTKGMENEANLEMELTQKRISKKEIQHEIDRLRENAVSKIHRIDLDFVDCNPHAEILPSYQLESYFNYYYAHCPNGITNVHAYNKVVYSNIYPNIDIVFYGGKEQGLKYDIIVKPGGNPDNIKLRYTGADGVEIKNNKLWIINSLGTDMTEELPKVYQNIAGKIVDVETKYILEGTTVSLELTTYNLKLPLIIDPWTNWITYYGGMGYDSPADLATDNKNGDVVVTGYASSTNFPVSPGAFQTNFVAISDIIVVKFDETGNRIWATYYGGSHIEEANGVYISSLGNIGITGYTKSNNFPVSTGAFQTILKGTNDGILVKFASNGTRLWGSYYGGSSGEQGDDIAIDLNDNILFCGTTYSTDLPFTPGAFQTQNAGQSDLFIAKFNTTGTQLWSTFYGGSSSDGGYGYVKIALDSKGSAAITGSTQSTDFPITSNAFLTTYSGIGGGVYGDAVIIKLGTNGNRLWASYYGGNGDDLGSDIAVDKNDNVVVVGASYLWFSGGNNFPVTSGAFQTNPGTQVNVNTGTLQTTGGIFILKFDSSMNRLWATYYNKNYYSWQPGCTVDEYNNIYILSEEEDEYASYSFSCAYQPMEYSGVSTTGTKEDHYIVKFNGNGNYVCGTFLGGTAEDDIDFSGGIACYKGYIYITALTRGGFPVTSNAYQNSFGGSADITLSKICGLSCGDPAPLNMQAAANQNNVCPNIPIHFTSSFFSCANDTIGTTYQWSFPGASILTSTIKNPTGITYPTPGNYNVKLIVHTPCGDDSVTKPNYITIIPCGFSTQATGQSICAGGCANLSVIAVSGTAPYTYSWSNGQSGQNINVCPPITTTYTVTVTDSLGNTSTDTALVFIPSPLSVTPTVTSASCNGSGNGSATANPAGGTSPYSYLWSSASGGGQTTAVVTGLSATSYTLNISDALGCNTYTVINVTEPLVLSLATATATANCNLGSGSATINPSGGTGPYSYLWSGGLTTQQISNLSSATYSATVTDNNGCTSTTAITIGNMPGVTAQLTSFNSVSCFGNCDGMASVSGNGGTNPYTYQWSSASGGLGGTNAIASNLCPSNYTATITDAGGCFSTANVTITEPAVFSVLTSSINVSCNGGNNGIAGINVTGGNSPYTYTWSPTSGGSTTQQISNLVAGSYSVTITDASGCIKDTSISIDEPSVLSYTIATTDAGCANNNGTATIHLSGGTPGYLYFWSTSGGGNDSTITGQSTGTYSITVFDNNGCTIQTTAIINNLGGLTATISSISNVSCNVVNDGSATVSASGGTSPYTYLWSNNSTDQQASNLTVGTYTVMVTDNNGCTHIQTTSITQPPLPIAAISGADSICPGDNVMLNASGGTIYHWSTGETTSTNNQQPATNTIYTITVSNGSCADSATIQIIVFSSPSVNAGNDTTIIAGQSIVVSASGGGMYSWNTGQTSQTINHQSTTTTTYIVTVTDINGCSSTDTVTIFIDSPCDNNTEVFVPNSFSPNEDGQNDVLRLYSTGIPETIYFAVYNRWGERVFETEDLQKTWDGTYRSKPADTAVFTWVLKITCKGTSTENIRTGNINLIR